METKIGLRALRVVFDNHELGVQAGDLVYVQSDVVHKHQWAKVVLRAVEKNFILIPDSFLVVIAPGSD